MRGVTVRSIFLGLVLAPVAAWWNMSIETIHYAGQPTTVSLYPHILFMLLCLIAANGILARIRPAWRMSAAEMITIYFFVLMAAVLSSHDILEVLVPILTYPVRYGNPANRWASEVIPYLPKWLVVSDAAAADKYYIGNASFWNARDIGIWLRPALAWTGFLTTLTFGMCCLNVLFRRHWESIERLSFPLAQLPVDLVQPRVPLFSSRLFWIAFALTAVNNAWFGLHTLFPNIPEPYMRFQALDQYITQPPWNAMGWLPLAVYPWIIGLGALLPMDLLVSASIFFWVWKLEPVVAAMYGYTDIPRFPFVAEQTLGSFIALAAFTIYTARHSLGSAISCIWRGSDGTDCEEPISYRFAVWGFLISSAAIFGFFALAGMSWWVIAVSMGIYWAVAIAIARLRAELGTPAHDPGSGGPMRVIPLLFGTQSLGRTDIVVLGLMHGFNRAYRAHPMPTQLEALHAGRLTKANTRALFWALILAAAWGTLSGFAVNLDLHYHWGAASHSDPPYVSTIFGREPYDQISYLIAGGVSPTERHSAGVAVVVGGLVTLVLGALRLRLVNFPLHPVGFAISSSWSMCLMWFSLLVALIIKKALFKAGGLTSYRAAIPFFLGMILGDCTTGSLWMLYSALSGTKSFIFWPYG